MSKIAWPDNFGGDSSFAGKTPKKDSFAEESERLQSRPRGFCSECEYFRRESNEKISVVCKIDNCVILRNDNKSEMSAFGKCEFFLSSPKVSFARG